MHFVAQLQIDLWNNNTFNFNKRSCDNTKILKLIKGVIR